jgi:hypothetical protein
MLTYSADTTLRLVLDGTLGGFHRAQIALQSGGETPIIQGMTGAGERLTLTGNLPTRMRIGSDGASQEWGPNLAFVGAHLKQDELRFGRAGVRLTYLPEWAKHSEISIAPTTGVRAATGRGVVAFSPWPDATGAQMVIACLEPPRLLPLFPDLDNFITAMRNLVSLGVGEPSAIEQILVWRRPTVGADAGADLEGAISVLVPLTYRAPGERRAPAEQRFLFVLGDLRDDLGARLDRWFAALDVLGGVADMFFGTRHAPGLYLENAFQNLIQAAEGFHRRRRRNEIWPAAEWEPVRAAAIAAVPAKYRDWLSTKLTHANEPSLKERLAELVDGFGPELDAWVGDRKRFVRRAVDTRHDQGHQLGSSKSAARHGAEFHRITLGLERLVEFYLLQEIGFPAVEARARMLRAYSWQLPIA